MSAPATDVIVIGGGLVGAAVGYGLADQGSSVTILDEGDDAFRASRGNFGLVWVQGKGEGFAPYAEWSRGSADLWPDFARRLSDELGTDIGYRKPGGVHLCLGDEEFEERDRLLRRMHNEAGPRGYDYRMLDRHELREMMPMVGDAVVGASYSPHDGHVSPLYLLRALHKGFRDRGGSYRPGRRVAEIRRDGDDFSVLSGGETLKAGKVVLAAGLGNRELGRFVGLEVPVSPLKGQILVTERAAMAFDRPTTFVRQTEEGSFMLGDSHEDVGFDISSTTDVMGDIARRAIRSFPFLQRLRVVRSWAALRIMTPDGFPIYEESRSHPGAFAASCHSGVTLAAQHALTVAPLIAHGGFNETLGAFSPGRFANAAV
ncbi:MAG TPA: FAD-dependent oxidoreductase [Paracoccaceae bacterium]|nr:FAD-dependent oxidoreductase [Paracoccaceae bacterium]